MLNRIIFCMLFVLITSPCLADDDFKMVLQGGSGSYSTAITISPDSNYFINTTSALQHLDLWSMDGAMVSRIPISGNNIAGAAFFPDSRHILINDFNTIHIYNTSGTLLKSIDDSYNPLAEKFSASQQKFADKYGFEIEDSEETGE